MNQFPPFTVRTDSIWSSKGVTKTSVSLTLKGSGSGVRFDPLGYGTYVIEADFRPDMTCPGQYLAFWIRNDLAARVGNYENTLEYFYEDPNAKTRILLTCFDDDDKVLKQTKLPTNAFIRHRITLTYLPDVQRVKAEGYRDSDSRWVDYAFQECKRKAEPGATLRIGIWGTPLYPLQYRGPERIVVHSVKFSPG